MTATLDGYVRVSRTAGRTGDTFISPDVQRDTIQRLAAAKGVEVGEIVQELDVSGARSIAGRELGRLVERVEAGESGGVIVWKLSRFSRNLADGVEAATRITRAGGRLLADDFDSAQPMGKAMLGLLTGLAEEELDQRRTGWNEARRRAVERGVANGRAPFGYRKGTDGRMVADAAEAKIVREAFERRAAGESFSAIARRFGWSHSRCRQTIANPCYTGVARSGAHVLADAHEPIVDRAAWDAANAARTVQPVPPGDTTRGLLLQGLARCAGCGRTLKVVRRPRRDGWVRAYYCKDAASTPCPSRAYVHTDALDAHVSAWFEAALATESRVVDVVAAGRELQEARTALAAAEADLVAYVEVAAALDRALFERGLAARQARVTEARELVAALAPRAARMPAGRLLDLWNDFDSAERAETLRGFLDRVDVERGASSDLPGHVAIVWSDGTQADDDRAVK